MDYNLIRYVTGLTFNIIIKKELKGMNSIKQIIQVNKNALGETRI